MNKNILNNDAVKKKPSIHPTAIVEDGAKIGAGVVIEAYAIVKAHVTLHDNVTIKSHVYIDGNTTIGEGTTIWPFACIGTKTQDKKYRGETTYVSIGKECEIREYVTINASCGEGTSVTVGDHCLIMAYCHIAHNCDVGDYVIMSNGATLAGHVSVGSHAIIGGLTPVHQFVRIGAFSMVGGATRVGRDIPPYCIGGEIPFKMGGINRVGLSRHGFPLQIRQELFKAFKLIYRSGLGLQDALNKIDTELHPYPEVKQLVEFCRSSKRGLNGHASSEIEAEKEIQESQE